MIHGPGVQQKYCVIMDARRAEVFHGMGRDESDYEARVKLLTDFQHELRNGTMEQFNEWYELYKDSVYVKPR